MKTNMRVTGREKFQQNKKLIKFVVACIELLPKCFRIFLWQAVVNWYSTVGVGFRYCIGKSLAKSMGDNVYFASNILVKNWENISFGDNVSIHEFCYIDASGNITIGNDVSIAHNVSLISFDHTWSSVNSPIKYNTMIHEPIVIGDDVWIGCGVRILKGVQIGRRSVIGAGAVVTRSFDGNCVLSGVPARVTKRI